MKKKRTQVTNLKRGTVAPEKMTGRGVDMINIDQLREVVNIGLTEIALPLGMRGTGILLLLEAT